MTQRGLGRSHNRKPPGEHCRPRAISSTEAARNFSKLLNRVKNRGETFIIEHAGEAVCELRPAGPTQLSPAELVSRLGSAPVDDKYLEIVDELIRAASPPTEPPS